MSPVPYWQTQEFADAHGQGSGYGRADVVAAVQAGASLAQISSFLENRGEPAAGVARPNTYRDPTQTNYANAGESEVQRMVRAAQAGNFETGWGTYRPTESEGEREAQRGTVNAADVAIYRAAGKSDRQIDEANLTFGTDAGDIRSEIRASADSARTNESLQQQIAAINASSAAATRASENELSRMQSLHDARMAESRRIQEETLRANQRLHDERLELMREQELAAQERARQVKIRGATQVGHRTSALGIRQRQSPFARQAAKGSLQLARSHRGNQAVTGLNV